VTFYSAKHQRTINFVYCGPHVEGPPGCVHGGATAALIDSTLGGNLWRSNLLSVTLNLNVNYRRFVPLNSVIICESWVEKIDGRKVYAAASVKSLDGTLHAEANSLWLQVDIAKMKREQEKKLQQDTE
jgi:thioesterase superfamily protein 4